MMEARATLARDWRSRSFGVFAESSVGLGFLSSISDIKLILTHEKLFVVGKRGPKATFNLIFVGFGWPWVGSSSVSL